MYLKATANTLTLMMGGCVLWCNADEYEVLFHDTRLTI